MVRFINIDSHIYLFCQTQIKASTFINILIIVSKKYTNFRNIILSNLIALVLKYT